jgi:hypothetical protein
MDSRRMKMKRNYVIGFMLLAVVLALVVWTPLRATEEMRISQRMLNAVATGSSAVGEYTTGYCRESAVYVVWGAGTTAGAVTIESSYLDTYTYTWAPLAVIPWSAAASQDIVQITGVHVNLRTRISTTVVGGTVSTWLVCN